MIASTLDSTSQCESTNRDTSMKVVAGRTWANRSARARAPCCHCRMPVSITRVRTTSASAAPASWSASSVTA